MSWSINLGNNGDNFKTLEEIRAHVRSTTENMDKVADEIFPSDVKIPTTSSSSKQKKPVVRKKAVTTTKKSKRLKKKPLSKITMTKTIMIMMMKTMIIMIMMILIILKQMIKIMIQIIVTLKKMKMTIKRRQ